MMKIFVLIDATEETGKESIIGVFESLERAKMALADYVLNATESIDPCYVYIAEFEVEK